MLFVSVLLHVIVDGLLEAGQCGGHGGILEEGARGFVIAAAADLLEDELDVDIACGAGGNMDTFADLDEGEAGHDAAHAEQLVCSLGGCDAILRVAVGIAHGDGEDLPVGDDIHREFRLAHEVLEVGLEEHLHLRRIRALAAQIERRAEGAHAGVAGEMLGIQQHARIEHIRFLGYQYFIEELEHHPECMLCNLVYSNVNKLLNTPDKQLEYSIWPVDQMIPEPEIDKEDDLIKPVYPSPADEYLFAHEVMRYVGSFPLPDAEEMLEIKFKWQSGHNDVNMISEIRAVIFGIDTGWKTISRSDWRTLATISVKDFRHIFVNGIKGKLRPQFWYDYFKRIGELISG